MTELRNSSKTADNRIGWIDTAKVLALLAVVGIHMGYYKVYLTSFALTTFFLCSGYTAGKHVFHKQVLKDLKRIILPYLIVSLLSVVFATGLRQLIFINLLGMNINQYSAESILIPTFMMVGWSIWWFFPCLFFGKTIFNAITALSNKKSIILICLLIFGITGYFLDKAYIAQGGLLLGESLVVCFAVIFICLGYELSGLDITRIRPVIRVLIAIVLALVYLVLVRRGYYIDLGVKDIPGYLPGLATGISGTLALITAASLIPENRISAYWGPRTLMLYCVHGLEHNFIPWSSFDEILGSIIPSKAVMVLLIVVRISLLLIITWLINKCVGVYFEKKKQVA